MHKIKRTTTEESRRVRRAKKMMGVGGDLGRRGILPF
jgi:hypothetical protein